MNKNELLKFCRYYKGETSNPFAIGTPNPGAAYFLWIVEHDWVEREIADAKAEILSDESSDILSAYREAGLIDFEKSDGVWLGLKASLYRLLQHWNEGVASSEDWAQFYDEWKGARF